MALSGDDRDGLRQYLLGQVAGDQQEIIEKHLLTDDEFFEELEIAEDELIDDYLSNELSPDRRQRFEQFFLMAPERQDQLKFARALVRQAPLSSPIEPTWLAGFRLAWNSQIRLFRSALAGAAIIVVGAFLFMNLYLSPAQTFATYTLTIGAATRGEGAPATKVKLPLTVDRLRLELKLPEGTSSAASDRVDLSTENGGTQTLKIVSRTQDSVVVEIPASQFTRGLYALKVFVIKPDGSEQPIRGSYLLTVE
jgi:hypothetical protein